MPAAEDVLCIRSLISFPLQSRHPPGAWTLTPGVQGRYPRLSASLVGHRCYMYSDSSSRLNEEVSAGCYSLIYSSLEDSFAFCGLTLPSHLFTVGIKLVLWENSLTSPHLSHLTSILSGIEL
jgi:hypothetical protein